MKNKNGGAGNTLLGILGLVLVLFIIKAILPSILTVVIIIIAVLAGLFAIGVILATVYAIKSGSDENKKRMAEKANKASSSSEEKKPVNDNDPEEIKNAKTNILKINALIRKVEDDEVRGKAYEAYNWALKIVNEISRQPHEIKRTKHFFSYYLPTLETVLEKYLTVESGGVADEAKEKAISCCSSLLDTYRKQYRSLFNDEMLDLTVEKKALDTMLARDGIREEA